MERYNASKDFMAEMVLVVTDFQKLKEFFTLCQDFGQES